MDSREEAFERDKVCYEQNCERFRSLDQMLWQVPIIAMTLTGGLWYAVATLGKINGFIRVSLLVLAVVDNLGLIVVLQRVRAIIQAHMEKIEAFNRDSFAKASFEPWYLPKGWRNRVVINTFSIFLCVSAIVSAVGIVCIFAGVLGFSSNSAYEQKGAKCPMQVSPFFDQVRSNWINENESAFAIRDIAPVSPGHTLIVPRRLVSSPFELTDKEILDCWNLLKAERERIETEFKPDGFNIGVNIGAAAGQTVNHAHIHLIPRYRGDNPAPRGGVRAVIPGKADY